MKKHDLYGSVARFLLVLVPMVISVSVVTAQESAPAKAEGTSKLLEQKFEALEHRLDVL
jgi:hypothetical protein